MEDRVQLNYSNATNHTFSIEWIGHRNNSVGVLAESAEDPLVLVGSEPKEGEELFASNFHYDDPGQDILRILPINMASTIFSNHLISEEEHEDISYDYSNHGADWPEMFE